MARLPSRSSPPSPQLPAASSPAAPPGAVPPPTRLHRILFIWGGLALILLFLGVSITPLTNNDIWLHMANGRWILEHGQVPLADPYSFSAAGHRFHAHEWLAGVIFHLVHLLSGVNGLILFKTALGGTALALAMTAAHRLGARPVSLAASTLVTLAVVNSRFLERPEMFSFAFTALYVLILARDHQRHGQPAADRRVRDFFQASLLWWLVPVQWLWVQIHGYFITGLALAGTFLLAETLDRLRRKEDPPSRLSRRRLISGWAALAVMTLLGLINPNGFEIYLFPFRLAGGDNIFMQTIFEWRPTFTTGLMTRSSMFLAFCAWLSLLTVGCLASPSLLRRDRLWRGVSVTGLLLLPALRPVLAAGATLSQAWETLRTGVALSPLPSHAGTGLPGATWLWSPAELMGSMTGQPGLATGLGVPLAPLRLLGAWGDDLFTLVWLTLAVMTVIRWRRPAATGLAVLATSLTFLALLAGSWAAGLVALTLLPALAWATWSRRLPFWQMAVTLVFLVLALRQNRNIVNFGLVTLPLVAPSLTRLRAALPLPVPGGNRRRHAAVAATAAVALAGTFLATLTFTAGWPYTPGISKKVGLGVGSRIPTGAVAYIRDRDLKGQVFNKYAYGAYLIHELYPATRVFMDSRNAVYGEKLYELYLNTLQKEQVAAHTFSRYRFDYVAIDYQFYPGRSPDQGLLSYLRSRPEWVLVEFDDRSLIYVRDDPEHAELIRKDAYRTLDPAAYQPGRLRDESAQVRAAFTAESSMALDRHPGSRAARLLAAEAALVAGQDSAALDLYEKVIAADPGDIFALVTAARVALRLGRSELGLAHYRHALALRPALDDLRAEFLQAEKRSM